MYIKPSTVKSSLVVARRGKPKKVQLSAETLAVFTALVNLMAKEALSRCAQNAANVGDKTITKEHFQRIIAQLMLDFSV